MYLIHRLYLNTSESLKMTQKNEPIVAKKGSYKVDVEEGKTYFWCSCGRSASQPFCDGSHSGTDFTPVAYKAAESKVVGFCGCKYSEKAPLCDGAHRDL